MVVRCRCEALDMLFGLLNFSGGFHYRYHCFVKPEASAWLVILPARLKCVYTPRWSLHLPLTFCLPVQLIEEDFSSWTTLKNPSVHDLARYSVKEKINKNTFQSHHSIGHKDLPRPTWCSWFLVISWVLYLLDDSTATCRSDSKIKNLTNLKDENYYLTSTYRLTKSW